MKIRDIFEGHSDEEIEKRVRDVVMMFQHNNNSEIDVEVIQLELRKNGIQIPIELVSEIIAKSGFDIESDAVTFGDGSDSDAGFAPAEGDMKVVTPAEQLANKAVDTAIKKHS